MASHDLPFPAKHSYRSLVGREWYKKLAQDQGLTPLQWGAYSRAMTNTTAPALTIDQPVTIDGFKCGCATPHRIHGSFRRYADGHLEVFTCYGSQLVPADRVRPA